MTVWIGTAGWSIRKDQAALFGDGASHLARYATRFNAAEINSSFYRPHRRGTYERWAASVPENFRFAAKCRARITHAARLKERTRCWRHFWSRWRDLGKLGPLLVQLPPSLAIRAGSPPNFFADLRAVFDGALACEPRHASWFGQAGRSAAEKASRCAGCGRSRACARRRRAGRLGRLSLLRWHGSPVMYRSDYPPERLAALAPPSRTATGAFSTIRRTARRRPMPYGADGASLAVPIAAGCAGRRRPRRAAIRSRYRTAHGGGSPIVT